jgi:phosphonate transport system ATP-binding protein
MDRATHELGANTPPERGAPRLELAHVSHSFGARVAVDDVSFQVAEHEFVAVLGPSGAGKTTLFRCMTGLTVPDRGSIHVAGIDVATLQGRARRSIGVVFQQFNLVSRLTALENVLAGRLGHVASWRGWTRRFAREDRLHAMECLDRVGLLDHATQRADRLSGGQQQRVAVARVLAQRPDIIVADEPVASLDPTTGAGILELLSDICRDEGLSVICSLHQVALARDFADRVIGLARGRVMFDFPVSEFDGHAANALYGVK